MFSLHLLIEPTTFVNNFVSFNGNNPALFTKPSGTPPPAENSPHFPAAVAPKQNPRGATQDNKR
jgi:hypothetical protein